MGLLNAGAHPFFTFDDGDEQEQEDGNTNSCSSKCKILPSLAPRVRQFLLGKSTSGAVAMSAVPAPYVVFLMYKCVWERSRDSTKDDGSSA